MGQVSINPGTILVPGLNIQGDSDTGITGPAANTLGFVTGGAERARVTSGGALLLGDTANANMTQGLTINQGAADDEILSLKSSDVAHGVTGTTETDTYLMIRKRTGANGSPEIWGFDDTANEGILVFGVTATTSTTHSAAGLAGVRLDARLTNGVATQAVSADGNLLAVSNYGSVRFIVDAEGDLFADGSDVTLYDTHDDVALARTLALVNAQVGAKGLVRSRWDRFVAANERTLIDLDILGGPRVGVPPEKRGLINYTALARLHNGALWQLHEDMMEIAALLPLKARRRLPARIQAQLLAAA